MLASLVRRSTAAFALLGALAACGKTPETAGPVAAKGPPVEVRLGRVEAASLPRVVRATGTLDADEVVVVSAEVAGRIVAIATDVGDRVKSGDALAMVDDSVYVLERDQRRRALSEALARLGLETLPESDVDFAKLPSVERARLEAENAKAKLDRTATLHDRKPPLISDQEFADVRTAWEVAVSGHRLALLTAQSDLATARTRRAELDTAEKRLRDTEHKVPAGGRDANGDGAAATFLVAERLVATGDRVSVGAALIRLVDLDPLRLRVQVPERRMSGVEPGRPAKLWIAADPKPVEGRVSRIRPEVDERTRTVDVEISVQNPDLVLKAGAFATAEIDVGVDSEIATVPESAVRSFAGVRKVFVVADGKAVEKVVVIGRRFGGKLEITSGLALGDEIVLEPPPELVAGSAVRAAAPGADTSGAKK